MAVLNAAQLGAVMRLYERKCNRAGVPVRWTKAQGAAAIQALEDWYSITARSGMNSALTAQLPGASAQEKTIAAEAFLELRIPFGV